MANMTQPSSTSSIKFLLVDDLEENLIALEALLAQDELTLLKARSGQEALDLLLNHDVALALIDVQMPDMDGFELAELMRGVERTRHVPIIFITAGIREGQHVFKGYDAGAVDFLFKPIDPSILKHKSETFFQLAKQRQALADTLRLNEELMAVVGHDLRNPLDVILMTAELLQSDTHSADVRKCGERLRRSGNRMRQIIDELLDMTRARLGGGIPIEPRPANLLHIARSVIAEIEAAHPERRLELQAEGDFAGTWDAPRLEQVMSNLLGNAVRHGSLEGPVRITLGNHDGKVSLRVHNAGHIPSELLPHVFEPFQGARESRGRSGGLGLGLYIVQQIVLAHGGRVDLHSTPTDGTTFLISLPRVSSAQQGADTLQTRRSGG
jgi:two-component system, sensor histidine kinase and response regulator